MRHPGLRILMTAGEVSGDRQAAHLAREMFLQEPTVRLYGTGGQMMREAGVEMVAQTAQYGSVGIQESLRFVKPLRRVLSQLRTLAREEPPDLVVLVDNEGFNGVLARFLHREEIPFVYYFPPQVWLWGEWRARRIARHARKIYPAFLPEAEIYRREGGRVEWYGHPLLDIVKIREDPEEVFKRFGLDPSRETIAIMPGSRHQEIEQLCGPMLGAARTIFERFPDMQAVLPLAAPHLRPRIEHEIRLANLGERIVIVTSSIYECLSRCRLLLLSSGTATLEGALLGIPMVVAYRVSPVTYAIGRSVVKSRFIAMPNILLDEEVVPEVLQHEVTADRLASLSLHVLADIPRSNRIRNRLSQVRDILGSDVVISRVAESILREAWDSRMRGEAGLSSVHTPDSTLV